MNERGTFFDNSIYINSYDAFSDGKYHRFGDEKQILFETGTNSVQKDIKTEFLWSLW